MVSSVSVYSLLSCIPDPGFWFYFLFRRQKIRIRRKALNPQNFNILFLNKKLRKFIYNKYFYTPETFGTIFVSKVFIVYFEVMHDELIHILNKVKSLYGKYGIKSVTMDDVSRELGISKKTLYQYVKDKTELVEKIVELDIERYGCFFDQLLLQNLNAIEELFEVQSMVSRMLRDHNPSQEYDLRKYYPDQYAKILKIRRERIYANILANLKKGKNDGLYRSELNEEIIAKIQLLRIETSYDTEIFTLEEIVSTKVFFEIFIYHIRGIANEQGIKLLENKLKELENINI